MDDQVVVVTGAGAGMGRANVRRCARPGVAIGLPARGAGAGVAALTLAAYIAERKAR